MSRWSSCCRPNAGVARIERAFERQGKLSGAGGVVVSELPGNRGYQVSDWQRTVRFATMTAAVRAAKVW